jgi:putative oxidoreductase
MEQIIAPLTKIGRFLIAIPSALFGVFHFLGASDMADMVPIPGGIIWVYITGVALLAAAGSIIMQKKARLSAALLGILMLIFALAVHLTGAIAGGDSGQMSTIMLLKDLMIAGGALVYASTQAPD